tara:strand:+ start:69 stop:623 length:555 start_codon:yes stop_codon:yes gene_type:complete
MRCFRGNVVIGGSIATYMGLRQVPEVADKYKTTITPSSDIDIFIRTGMEPSGVKSVFMGLIPQIERFEDKPGNPEYYKMPGITAVKTFYSSEGLKVNVVLLDPEVYKPLLVPTLMEAMGHSLAEALLIPSYGKAQQLVFKASPAFYLGIKNQIVTVRKRLLTPKALRKIEQRALSIGYSISYKN